MNKKAIILCLAMMILPLLANAHDFVKNGIYYRFNNNDVSDPTVAVTYMGRYSDEYKNEYTGHVSIPSTVTHWGKTYRVTEIYDGAFEDCDRLTSIYIPSSVTKIGSWLTFSGCSNLTAVHISSIEAWCKIDFGTNPLKYAHNLYLNGKLVTKLVIPEGVTSIGEWAFYGYSRLTSVTIPSSVTRIEDNAFVGCSSLEEIIFKDGSTTLWLGDNYNLGDDRQGLFYDCPLKKVYLGRNLSYGTSQSRGFSPFYNKKTLESLTIGNGVNEIGANAFSGCGLTSITIPESVTEIREDAFKGCTFTSVKCPERFYDMFEIYTQVGDFVFREGSVPRLVEYKGGSREIVLPKDFKGKKYVIDTAAFSKLEDFSIVISEGVTKIESGVFEACGSGLTNVIIPNSVTEIGEGAFANCSGLKTIIIPEGVTVIGEGAFRGCSKLPSITIPASVTSIGANAFDGCSGLTCMNVHISSVESWIANNFASSLGRSYSLHLDGELLTKVKIPSSVATMPDYVFSNCSSLTSITIPEGVYSIGKGAFFKCSNLASISIPKSMISIRDGAFGSCSSLTSVIIPENVTSIGNEVFNSCSSLTSITIPEGVTSIGNYTFCRCSSLSSIAIPESVNKIGRCAFYNCSRLTSITIPEGVASIGEHAFYGCKGELIINCNVKKMMMEGSKFSKIVFGGKETEIEDEALSGYQSVKSVVIFNGVTSIGTEAFNRCSNLSSITIPESVVEIGKYAFSKCPNLVTVIAHKSWKKIFKENRLELFNGCNKLEKITYVK